jgi:hypothetical protein
MQRQQRGELLVQLARERLALDAHALRDEALGRDDDHAHSAHGVRTGRSRRYFGATMSTIR